MPPNYDQQQGLSLRSHQRKGIFVIGAVLVLVACGLGIWDLAGGSSGPKQPGPCVSVVVPSATGGGTLEQCGSDARAWCITEAHAPGVVASQIEAACRRQGL